MKKITIAAALLILSVLTVAARKADATFSGVKDSYTLNADGSVSHRVQKTVTYNTNPSFFSMFGETFITYNPEFQKLKINDSYTVQADGTRIVTPANAFNEVLPSGAANSADFNGLREMVVTHTGLEKGAKAFLDYTIESAADGVPTLDIDKVIPVQGAEFTDYTLEVTVPEGRQVDWSVAGSSVKPVVKGNTYTWTFRNIASASGEANTPLNHDGQPRISVTTAESLGAALAPFTVETLDICRAPEGVVSDTMDVRAKTDAVRDYVAEGIALARVEPALLGNHLRQCASVVRSAIGTEAEKALALAKMLRGEGIDAQAVVVLPAGVKAKNPAAISRWLVRTGDRYLSPLSTKDYEPALRADRDEYFTLGGEKIDIAPVRLALDVNAVIDLSADSVKIASRDIALKGSGKSAALKGGEKVERQGDYTLYTLPVSDAGIDSWEIRNFNGERLEAIELPCAIDETDTYTVNLKGVVPAVQPYRKSVSNAAGKVSISIEPQGDKVTVSRSISLARSIYPAAEYKLVRELLQAWLAPSGRRIVVR